MSECICHLLSDETKKNLKKHYEKRELRHGDYGRCNCEFGGIRLFAQSYAFEDGNKMHAINENGQWHLLESNCNPTIFGNIFDDIKAKKDC